MTPNSLTQATDILNFAAYEIVREEFLRRNVDSTHEERKERAAEVCLTSLRNIVDTAAVHDQEVRLRSRSEIRSSTSRPTPDPKRRRTRRYNDGPDGRPGSYADEIDEGHPNTTVQRRYTRRPTHKEILTQVGNTMVKISEYHDGTWSMHKVDNQSGRETLYCYNEAYRLRMNIPDYSLNPDGTYREIPDPPFRSRSSSQMDTAQDRYTDYGAQCHPSVATRNPQRRNADGTYSSIAPWELRNRY